ncbi:MAG: hypothetical protein ABEI96_02435 [Haloarculaceae archaeon]
MPALRVTDVVLQQTIVKGISTSTAVALWALVAALALLVGYILGTRYATRSAGS